MTEDNPYIQRITAIRDFLVMETDHEVDDFIGCPIDAVIEMEKILETKFPPALRAYYQVMGAAPGALFNDNKARLAQLPEIRRVAEELIEDENGPLLPRNAIVFSERYGEQFLFVERGENPDPKVHRYFEGDAEFTMLDNSFTDIVESEAFALVAVFDRVGSIRKHIRPPTD